MKTPMITMINDDGNDNEINKIMMMVVVMLDKMNFSTAHRCSREGF